MFRDPPHFDIPGVNRMHFWSDLGWSYPPHQSAPSALERHPHSIYSMVWLYLSKFSGRWRWCRQSRYTHLRLWTGLCLLLWIHQSDIRKIDHSAACFWLIPIAQSILSGLRCCGNRLEIDPSELQFRRRDCLACPEWEKLLDSWLALPTYIISINPFLSIIQENIRIYLKQ